MPGGRRKPKGGKGTAGGSAVEDCNVFNANYNVATESCDDSENRECSFADVAPSLEQILTCAGVLFTISMIRSAVQMIVKFVYHRPVPISLQFPAWEGPVLLVQYLALCEGTVGMMALNCTLWMALGVVAFCAIPILLIAISYGVLRKHILRDHLRFVRFKAFSKPLAQANWAMGKGCFGKSVACYVTCIQFKLRGEWEHDPFGGSSIWSFLIEEYVGDFWCYAITRLVKKVAMSAVLGLTDGALNAALAIGVQFCDTICILYTRPHVGRDTDITECFCAIFNLLFFMWIGMPLLFPGLAAYLSDYVALLLSLATALASLSPVLPKVLLDIFGFLSFIMNGSYLGAAKEGIIGVVCFMANRSEEEIRERMRRKYVRDLELERKSVRLQMLVERPPHLLTRAQKLEAKGLGQETSRKLGIAVAHYECPLVYVRQAIAFAARAGVYDIMIRHGAGPPISVLDQERGDHEDRVLAFCMGQHPRLGALCAARGLPDKCLTICLSQSSICANSRILTHLLVSNFHIEDSKRSGDAISSQVANGYRRIDDDKEMLSDEDATTLLDIVVKTENAEIAKRAVDRLQEDTILASLRNHKFYDRAHLIHVAIQQEFVWTVGSLHPLTTTPGAAVIQASCRRMLVLNDQSNPYTERRQQRAEGLALVYHASGSKHKLVTKDSFSKYQKALSQGTEEATKKPLLNESLRSTQSTQRQKGRPLTFWEMESRKIEEEHKKPLLNESLRSTQSAQRQKGRPLTFWEIQESGGEGEGIPVALQMSTSAAPDTGGKGDSSGSSIVDVVVDTPFQSKMDLERMLYSPPSMEYMVCSLSALCALSLSRARARTHTHTHYRYLCCHACCKRARAFNDACVCP